MNSLPSRLRSLLVAVAVLTGLLVPLLSNATAADAATRHHSCKYAYTHASYRHHHPKWWAHHCPHLAWKLRHAHKSTSRTHSANGVAAAHVTRLAPVTRGTSVEQQIAVLIGSMINDERRANHLPSVSMDRGLVLSAQRHNQAMARYNTMSHQLPGESDLGRRIDAAGYHWMWAGENVAWNSAMSLTGVRAVQTMMYNEKAPNNGHRLNILNPHFRNVGVNVLLDYAHHKIWLTTDFGSK